MYASLGDLEESQQIRSLGRGRQVQSLVTFREMLGLDSRNGTR